MKSIEPHSVGSLLFYNITLHVGERPDIIVDVTDAVAEWERALRCHATQLRAMSYLELQLTAARLLGLSAGVGYGIGLISNDPIRVDHVSSLVGARAF